ncbi:MAG: DUF6089 family protein [Bacteroidales bacterium]|nr:DUF6089 family protein [Bacteroidales bacterium]
MNKNLIILIILFFTLNLKSQNNNIEPGITLGTSYYLGDINHSRQFYSPGLAYGLAVRHSFNDYYAVRLNILKAKITGNDADFSNIYQQTRGYSFTNNIIEVGLQTEFNFSDFNSNIRKSNAPFITGGLAVAVSNSFSDYTIAIPIGIGYKYSPSKKITISAEWVFRITASDKMDLLLPNDANLKQITKANNNDWYSVAGITVTYNLKNDKKWCPAYQKPRK